MLGAIAGDIIGSVYEVKPTKRTDFRLFRWDCTYTDDTVLTAAVAESILYRASYAKYLRAWFREYPSRGFGFKFRVWAQGDSEEGYGSRGNGSAMRVSPIGFAFDTLERVVEEARKSAEATHNHPDAVAGAEATAAAVFLARNDAPMSEIRELVESRWGYDLSETVESIRAWYRFDVSCKGTVPYAIRAFLDSESYEDAVRKAVSLGGDSDTLACITGGIAHARWGLPQEIREAALEHLDDRLRGIVARFEAAYPAARRQPGDDAAQ